VGNTWDHKRTWWLQFIEGPTCTVVRLGTSSRAGGTQVWDEMVWPIPVTNLTEAGILSEFYDAVLAFWETRA